MSETAVVQKPGQTDVVEYDREDDFSIVRKTRENPDFSLKAPLTSFNIANQPTNQPTNQQTTT